VLTEADAASMHALVAGPGMGADDAARDALERVLAFMPGRPALLDADALNVLAGDEDAIRRIAGERPLVITPHARELSRLTGSSVEDIVADAPASARDAARRFGCAVLLKGQPSLVAEPNGRLAVNTTGSSDVATAGMGDQLAGTIGAFLPGDLEPAAAAALGLFLCGRAADLSGLGRSLAPADVSAALPRAMTVPGLPSSALGLPFVSFDQPARW
jgi:ADP-dependent NAD(P)H-hydrate dehydratase / NAD(P)H-hydrate epimerase